MGTRNIIWILFKGKWRIAQYGQWDGYPEGQGIKIVKFLNDTGNGWKHSVIEGVAAEIKEEYLWGKWEPGQVTDIEALKAAFDNDLTYPAHEGADDIAFWESQLIRKEASLLEPSEEVLKLQKDELMPFFFEHQLLEGQMQAPLVLGDTLDQDVGAYILGLVAHATEKVPLEMAYDLVSSSSIEWQYVIDLDKNLLEIYCGHEKVDDTLKKGRWDGESFLDKRRPKMMKSYTFDELVGKTRNDLVDEANAVLKRRT